MPVLIRLTLWRTLWTPLLCLLLTATCKRAMMQSGKDCQTALGLAPLTTLGYAHMLLGLLGL